MSDSINRIDRVEKEVEDVRNEANKAITSANGKNTTYYGPAEPTGKLVKGDTWFRVVDGQYTRTYRYDGIEWKLILDMADKEVEELADSAKKRADEAFDSVENLETLTESIGVRVGSLEKPNMIPHNEASWNNIVAISFLKNGVPLLKNTTYTFKDFSEQIADSITLDLGPEDADSYELEAGKKLPLIQETTVPLILSHWGILVIFLMK